MLMEARSLTFGLNSNPIIRNLSFRIDSGEALIVSGSNGAGKSTLLRVLLGQLKPISGDVITHLKKSCIAYLPQLHNGDFHIPIKLGDVLSFTSKGPVDFTKVEEIGLLTVDDLTKSWNSASGGERQRTLLTRVFMQDSKLTVLDEPMNHLDHCAKSKLESFMRVYTSSLGGKALIVVSHAEFDSLELGEKSMRITKIDLDDLKVEA